MDSEVAYTVAFVCFWKWEFFWTQAKFLSCLSFCLFSELFLLWPLLSMLLLVSDMFSSCSGHRAMTWLLWAVVALVARSIMASFYASYLIKTKSLMKWLWKWMTWAVYLPAKNNIQTSWAWSHRSKNMVFWSFATGRETTVCSAQVLSHGGQVFVF